MSKKLKVGLLVLSLLLVLPVLATAKDEASGAKMKLKNAKVLQVIPEKGTIVVKKGEGIYNIVFAFGDEDKMELLSKYGVNVDPWDLEPDDHVTCRGRRFPTYFVPSKCRIEKDSQKKLYKDKKGLMVADVYAVDPVNNLIYAAHSLNKTDLTVIKVKDTDDITYKGEHRSIDKLEPYWRLKIKGEWDKDENMFKDVEYVRIWKKNRTEPEYRY